MQGDFLHLLNQRATAEGFAVLGVASAKADAELGAGLAAFLQAGYHGDMTWLADTKSRRAAPQAMWQGARSAVVLGMNYAPAHNPLDALAATTKGNISVYARGRDYHDIIKGKLKQLASVLTKESGVEVKVFVDTAPLMEKPLAAKAGLGWQGKHTNLVSRQFGSWLFIGVILTSADLPLSAPEQDHCGSCRRCLDVCPTDAFPAPYQLDARRCISYLTIEYDGIIPHEFRVDIGNRIFGCDDCLAICPWNRFAQQASEVKLTAKDALTLPDLRDLLQLNAAGFRALTQGTSIKRSGYKRFLRNVLIAAGNSGAADLVAHIKPHLNSEHSAVRASAIWACARLMDAPEFTALASKADESDQAVLSEWEAGINICATPANNK